MIGNLAAPLTTGMPIVMSYRFDANVALELIERDGATFTVASITVFIALMNANTAGERDLSAFHKIVSGGAPIAAATIEAYEQTFGSYIHTAPRRRLPRRRTRRSARLLGARTTGAQHARPARNR